MRHFRCGLFLALFSFALPAGLSARDLRLIPEPRQVKRKAGEFLIAPATRLVVAAAHAAEDRLAAETLAEEIESATGKKITIATARATPKLSGVIYLARIGDDANLRRTLDAVGLAMDDKFDDEGYVLDADASRILVSARTAAGLFYGAQTLRQLLARNADRVVVPSVSIKDWPAMRWRGLHDDISRGPVPTLDYMKRQIRTVAEFKLNLFSLYIEHVFDYQSHPLIGPPGGALTAAEIKELVEYAKRYHVTLLPEQQAFGHLHHVLKNEIYSGIAETPHGHVLAPVQEDSYKLIKDLYAELVPLFPGPLFHIGSDETFELGQGQTKDLAQREGLGRVYLEHLKRVAEIMKPYNKRLMFWGDIAMHYPQLLGILPKDVIAVAWNYGAAASFDNMLKPYKDAELDLFVSPGANNWNRIFPNLDVALVNIRNFVRDGQKFGALGTLNTTWDDDGEAIFGMTWPAVVFGAACSWQPGESSIEDFLARYDWAFYRHADSTVRDALTNLSRAHLLLANAGLGDASNDVFWLDPFTEQGARYAERAAPIASELRLAAERALESLYRFRLQARARAESLDALIFAAQRLDLLGMKIQFTLEISRFYGEAYRNLANSGIVRRNMWEITGINARLEDLRDSTTQLREAYSKLWLSENRPYWLGNVLIRYDNLAALFQAKIQQVKLAGRQYSEKRTLPPPEELGFLANP